MLLEEALKSKSIENGINVHRLKEGTILLIVTKNSLYKIIKGPRDVYDITIQGGKKLPKPVKANFAGSTFGGSLLKIGWIGFLMHMEIHIPSSRRKLTTTGVRAARIIGDGWEYDMEWKVGET